MYRRLSEWTLPVCLLLALGFGHPAKAQFQIVTSTLPAATPVVSYSQPIATSGLSCSINTAAGTATASIDSGALPPGISVTASFAQKVGPAWTIQGIPSAAGNYTFTLHLKYFHAGVSPFDPDCTNEATKSLSLAVGNSGSGGGGGTGGGGTGGGGTGGGGGGGTAGQVTLSTTQVSATYHLAHFPPAPASVQVTSASGSAVSFTTQTATSNGGPWLSVSPLSGTTPATLSLQFTISGLAAGVYSGTVTVLSGGVVQATINVVLTVVADTGIVLAVNPPSLQFSSTAGAAAPAPQSVQVTAPGEALLFQANVSAPPTGKWFTVSPGGAATNATLNVTVDPKGLAPGTYKGLITLQLSGFTTAAQTIPVTYTVTAAPTLPVINTNGVLNAGSLTGAIAPGAWVSIFGANLAGTTRQWASADFVGGKLPTSLDNVSVTIDGRPAAISYVSPTQINALAPDDLTTGLVFVQVKSPAGTSDNALVLQQTAAPAFFQFHAPSTNYVAATHADNSTVAGAALVQQQITGTPAKPGETIVLYGTGFGATQPIISATSLVSTPLPLANPQDLRIRIGGVDAQVVFAGLVAPGLYQFNVVVPNVPDGDQLVSADLRGLATQAGLMLSVQR